MNKVFCIWGLLFFLVASPGSAQDAKGTSDHPVVGRFLGSTIIQGERKAFDERQIQVQAIGPNDIKPTPAQTISRTGVVTNLLYEAPKERSSLEIAANYQQRLQALGYKPLFVCITSACPGFGSVNRVLRFTFGEAAVGAFGFSVGFHRNPRYLVMEKSTPASRSTVAILVGEGGGSSPMPARYTLLVVDQAAMETGQITIPTPQAIVSAFRTEGRIALYGVFFDTGQATIKPESTATLAAVAEFMRQQPGVSLVVAGHTDNVGDFASNVALSQRRAAAVTAALAGQYKIAANRLTPFGAGMAAPIAPNTSDAGRAKNRRVELIPR